MHANTGGPATTIADVATDNAAHFKLPATGAETADLVEYLKSLGFGTDRRVSPARRKDQRCIYVTSSPRPSGRWP